jgi:NADH-quinone oxidoreductase subunit F
MTALGQEIPTAPPPDNTKPEVLPIQLISEHFGNSKAKELKWYRKQGGYEGAQKALEMQPGDITEMVIHANLRGLGGAGFPTGRKWSFVPQDTGKPIYLTANADESEPGTFKDRYLMEWDPHRLLEGIIICAYAVGIHTTYIYIRGEYVRAAQILQKAIEEAYREGVLGERVLGKDFQLDVHLHRGAGAYICGEETGLLESLEGKKGWPRLKPPFPAVVGLFGCPTVVNNVETLSQLPKLLLNGAEWFAAIASKHHGGTRLFALSGCVKRPGVYELPLGTSIRELIYDHGGGVLDDKQLKAIIPGGASSGVLTSEELDVTLDFDSLMKAGSMLGSGAVIVMDEDVCMVRACQNIMRFFAHESCGQCTPCREGTGWVYQILTRIIEGNGTPQDVATLEELADNMTGTSICPLCDGSVMSFRSYVTKFRSEFEYHILHKKCDLEEKKTTVDA